MKTEFQFAGFNWPRLVATLTPLNQLRKKRESRKYCGPYYHAPKPTDKSGIGFYLDSAGQPFTRWKWCDDVLNNIGHTGWFCDRYAAGDTIRGIVVYLPHGRFSAGYSMGDGMASFVDGELYDDETSAAYAADSMAENAAERQREYEETLENEE